jgi:hypothetical protein
MRRSSSRYGMSALRRGSTAATSGISAERASTRRMIAGIDQHAVAALAEFLAERGHVIAVAFEDQPALALERGDDRVGADVRVAVHVAADPGAEAQQRPPRHPVRQLGVGRGEAALELGVAGRHRTEQHVDR